MNWLDISLAITIAFLIFMGASFKTSNGIQDSCDDHSQAMINNVLYECKEKK